MFQYTIGSYKYGCRNKHKGSQNNCLKKPKKTLYFRRQYKKTPGSGVNNILDADATGFHEIKMLI